MSASTLHRQPPQPPPKPKSYQLPNQMKLGDIAPQDSDTDSGICADSDQSSPRQGSQSSIPSSYSSQPQYIYRHLTDENRDYLTPNSARRLFHGASEPSRRTLPPRPGTAQSQQRSSKSQFRVRFADEVDSGASTSSSASSEHSNSPRAVDRLTAVTNYATTFNIPSNNFSKYEQSLSDRRFDSLPRALPTRRMSGPNTFTIEDVESLPGPPSYNIALQRLRSLEHAPRRESIRDSVIRQNIEDTLSRTMRNRSSSLPRGNQTSQRSRYEPTPDFRFRPQMLDYQMNRLGPMDQMVGSLDNLRVNTEQDHTMNTIHDELMKRRRRLPVAPLMGSNINIPDAIDANREVIRQPAFLKQRRCRGRVVPPPLTRRSASVGRYPDSLDEFRPTPPPTEPSVRAQLIALDQRGFRTVLVEKTQPGPFGFYIATGVMNGQRGIFISRVSLPSLTPMLSIGDEILYVDDELVKGRTLEYVQSLIAGKTSVVIVLMPTVGPALC
ncbi:unnamed protein product [Auanema sp. JU1783]|nr:unnamed protein product [Auanema sp. JU1783]